MYIIWTGMYRLCIMWLSLCCMSFDMCSTLGGVSDVCRCVQLVHHYITWLFLYYTSGTASDVRRYRWVVFCDYDEWLLPMMHPAVPPVHGEGIGYSELLKRIRADPTGLLDPEASDFGQEKGEEAASWPVAFM